MQDVGREGAQRGAQAGEPRDVCRPATVELTGSPSKADLEACWELGATVAATLMG